MTTLPTEAFQPLANHVLVAVPERFIEHYKQGEKRLILPGGDDNFEELYQALKHGENCHIEEDPNAHRTPVSAGQVLAVPRQLTADMILCAGLGTMQVPRLEVVNNPDGKPVRNRDGSRALRENGWQTVTRPKTCADIQNPVEVGDTVHFEHCYLSDDTEVMPGVYLLPYTALIAVIVKIKIELGVDDATTEQICVERDYIKPIAGYVLLSRVWADDVTDETNAGGGLVKCRKNAAGLVVETNVPPLPNEGVVAGVHKPLHGNSDEVKVGQRLVIHGGHALVEKIARTEYLVVRQEYCLAERLPMLYGIVVKEAATQHIKDVDEQYLGSMLLPQNKPDAQGNIKLTAGFQPVPAAPATV